MQYYNYREIVTILEEVGWYIDRTIVSHRILKHQSKSGIVVIPGKPSDDIPVGTLSSIWKQAKL
ncbi:type II toxin-antitoxin system HicA family toxin [Dolichospermum heterosporum TAC447]|uniref:Type II toxin-antitoxin system HicA family toxin n=1 Tax=Dolichospermum heterosporum TAC447 TaxID=747523 RepID=A0ABY5M4X9_9CYAN|nr:type II toxin-antitoxin system HicA family toxin [Dolichospermum heterosporum TAC447]